MTVMTLPATPWTNGQTTTDGRFYYDSSAGGVGAWRSTPLPVGGLPAGSIIQWSSNTAPANWLICDGSAVSRTTYSSLFAVIGTTYGTGDGSTTFNLPDLRGRVPVGKNAGTFSSLAGTGGAESNTHNHYQSVGYDGGALFTSNYANMPRSKVTSMNRGYQAITQANSTARIDSTENETISTLPPYLVVNYIIKVSAGWTAGDSELATRVGALEAADAGANKSGLVPVVPTSIAVSGGSASVAADGTITFTNVSSVSLNNVFGSTYRNYRAVYDINGASQQLTTQIRMRASGTDKSGANYYQQGVQTLSGTVSSYSASSSTFWYCGDVNTNFASVVADLFSPYQSTRTNMSFQQWGYNGGDRFVSGSMTHNESTPSDGMTLFASAGTITGTLKLYGYR